MALEYMYEEMIEHIRKQHGTEAQVEAYSQEWYKATSGTGNLPCPFCYVKKGELNHLKTADHDEYGVSSFKCESCHHEFKSKSIT